MSKQLRSLVEKLRNNEEADLTGLADELEGIIESSVIFPKKKDSTGDLSAEAGEGDDSDDGEVSDKQTRIFSSMLKSRIAERAKESMGDDSSEIGDLEE